MTMAPDSRIRAGSVVRWIPARTCGDRRITTPSQALLSPSDAVHAARQLSVPWSPRPFPVLHLMRKTLPHINQQVFQSFHFFQCPTGAERDAAQRVVGDRDRQAGGV